MGEYLSQVKQAIEAKKNNEISYDELGNVLLGVDNNYSKDNIRKAYYVLAKMMDKLENDSITQDEILLKNEKWINGERLAISY